MPPDDVTTNLKTENGTDFRETNGKHAENHQNGTGNNIDEDKSEVEDAEESIDLTDKVRKILLLCNYDYGFLLYLKDKMRRNEINKSVCEVSNLCSRSSRCRF